MPVTQHRPYLLLQYARGADSRISLHRGSRIHGPSALPWFKDMLLLLVFVHAASGREECPSAIIMLLQNVMVRAPLSSYDCGFLISPYSPQSGLISTSTVMATCLRGGNREVALPNEGFTQTKFSGSFEGFEPPDNMDQSKLYTRKTVECVNFFSPQSAEFRSSALGSRVAHETLGFDTLGFRTGNLPTPAGGVFVELTTHLFSKFQLITPQERKKWVEKYEHEDAVRFLQMMRVRHVIIHVIGFVRSPTRELVIIDTEVKRSCTKIVLATPSMTMILLGESNPTQAND
ncbi:hypothetical protein ARMGADRAFT_1035658 [Armillaria gallica]|uniref:Uncharacterized protein n=1 Tax=Armillaria gallica TaxID=47427 RepID=A0A2H3D5W9_ARMGA|nr:hypothetical protein ARMGADRAFT_1035658 [Armillaria gallica]